MAKTELDLYVIERVRELRNQHQIPQKELSLRMGFSEGFVGHIENPRRRDKYNLNHLNILAKIFECSPRDFLPEKPL